MKSASSSLPHGNRLSFAEKIHERYHRSHYIIHTITGMWHVADFQTEAQLQAFARLLGFSYFLTEEREHPELGIYREYQLSHQIVNAECCYFMALADLPDRAVPFYALSNGSIVTCYFVNDGQTITIYRPNPNKKEIYTPMSTMDHIRYQQKHGIY